MCLVLIGVVDVSVVLVCVLGGVEYSFGGLVVFMVMFVELSFGLKYMLCDVVEVMFGFVVFVGLVWSGYVGVLGVVVVNLIVSLLVLGFGLVYFNVGWSVVWGYVFVLIFGMGLEYLLGLYWLLLVEGYV